MTEPIKPISSIPDPSERAAYKQFQRILNEKGVSADKDSSFDKLFSLIQQEDND